MQYFDKTNRRDIFAAGANIEKLDSIGGNISHFIHVLYGDKENDEFRDLTWSLHVTCKKASA